MSKILHYGTFKLEDVAGGLDERRSAQLLKFWIEHKAIRDESVARQRLKEVVVLVENAATGEISGVTTRYIGTEPVGGRYYFYRMFIRPENRRGRLFVEMTRFSMQVLQRWSRVEACNGIMLITENRKLMDRGAKRVISMLGYEYFGKTKRMQDIWRYSFQKSPSL